MCAPDSTMAERNPAESGVSAVRVVDVAIVPEPKYTVSPAPELRPPPYQLSGAYKWRPEAVPSAPAEKPPFVSMFTPERVGPPLPMLNT
jgi:hypothetical protein